MFQEDFVDNSHCFAAYSISMDGFKKQLVKGLSKKNVGIPGEESSNQLALAGNDDPEQIYDMLVSSRKTHFSEEELARLLAAFKRVAKNNRLQVIL